MHNVLKKKVILELTIEIFDMHKRPYDYLKKLLLKTWLCIQLGEGNCDVYQKWTTVTKTVKIHETTKQTI